MRLTSIIVVLTSSVVLASCGSSAKDSKAGLNDKKAQLEKLKSEKGKLDTDIKKLEQEIATLDPEAKNAKAKLVGVSPVVQQDFTHFIELQGNVTSDNISYVSPRMGPAQVTAIYIKEGQYVKKGQLLLKLDNRIMQQSVIAAEKGLATIKTQLAYSKNIYDRQNNLWKEGIGTEVQLLTAKTNVETLESQLISTQENVKVAKEQLNTANVYSDVNGIVEKVNVRVGETFSGFMGNQPQIQIVNNSSLKVVINVPENYSNRIKVGSRVEVEIPDAAKIFPDQVINVSGQYIDPTSRSFNAEVKIPGGGNVRANQIAKVKIKDYFAPNAITVPVNVVQTDESGKYVYVAAKEGSVLKARKKKVNIGEVFEDEVEIKAGLNASDVIITEGYQVVYEGQTITAADSK